MIVTSYTRLVMDCHREECSNRFHLVTNGFFAKRARGEAPESYRLQPSVVMMPLPVGRDALEMVKPETVGTA
jgi:hypothetical protein